MIPGIRQHFNLNFSEEKYRSMVEELTKHSGKPIPFRVAETPVFIADELKLKLLAACDEIIRVINSESYREVSARAIPKECFVPGREGNPLFLAFDFAVCLDESGNVFPQLIELQGFPSLFFYQHLLAQMYKKHFDTDDSLTHLFSKSDSEYEKLMREALLNGHHSENVILLEIEPEKQNTWIDFAETFRYTGIPTLCITQLIREGRKLFYFHDGNKIPVHRIYNRVIFDELKQRTDLKLQFHLTEDVDVEWAGHPNWFFRVSKFTMPFLKSPYVPETKFLNQLVSIPDDLHNYVLKPLFSFSGAGVVFHVTTGDISKIKDPENWILQRKVNYAPVIKTPEGKSKLEIRMLYCWPELESGPVPVINLCRLSQGEMIGVKYNRDKTWVGSSVGFWQR